MRVPGQGSSSSLSQMMKHKPALREARAVERNIYPPETVVLFSLSGPEIKTQKGAESPPLLSGRSPPFVGSFSFFREQQL